MGMILGSLYSALPGCRHVLTRVEHDHIPSSQNRANQVPVLQTRTLRPRQARKIFPSKWRLRSCSAMIRHQPLRLATSVAPRSSGFYHLSSSHSPRSPAATETRLRVLAHGGEKSFFSVTHAAREWRINVRLKTRLSCAWVSRTRTTLPGAPTQGTRLSEVNGNSECPEPTPLAHSSLS